MDILFPIIGEVMGGSQRYELLLNRMQSRGVYEKLYWWYLIYASLSLALYHIADLG